MFFFKVKCDIFCFFSMFIYALNFVNVITKVKYIIVIFTTNKVLKVMVDLSSYEK